MEQKTKTFAEIYESQGHYDQALNIYIDLLKENPLDADLIDKIKDMQNLILSEKNKKKKAIAAKINLFNNLLDKIEIYKTKSVKSV
ncbi:MAG: tetratricopeptide repeat protein [bacterium]